MATNYTTMTVGNYVFEFDFDTRYLRIAWAETPPVLVGRDEAFALRDFLVEVLSTQEQPESEETRQYMEHHYLGGE